MNKRKLFMGACLALLFAACSDDIGNGTKLPADGSEVNFGAGSGHFKIDQAQRPANGGGAPQVRTVYDLTGDHTFANYTTLEVKWQQGDKIRIYSPQAMQGYQSADYEVLRKDADDGAPSFAKGFLSKIDEMGIRWGDPATPHKFYAFYPTRVTSKGFELEGLQHESKIKARIPVSQEHGGILTFDPDGNPTTEQNGAGYWKIVKPDMQFAMMMAEATYTPDNFNGEVNLNFQPFVTVLDVVITGPKEGETPYRINEVMVRSKSQSIVGNFTYDFETKQFGGMDAEDEDDRMSTVDCMHVHPGETLPEPVTLAAGQHLNVKFFLLPRDIKAGELTLSVLMEGGNVLHKNLGDTDGSLSQINLAQGKIIKVKTPHVSMVGQANNWMSLIDDDVYFASQLSIPGTKHSYTYTLYESEKGAQPASKLYASFQSRTIAQQFDAGIRAFDVKVNADGGNKLYVARQTLNTTIGDFLDEIKKCLDASPTEAAMVAINYVGMYSNGNQWLAKLKPDLEKWGADNPGYLARLTPQNTMGEMRKKIAITINCIGTPNTTINDVLLVNDYNTSVQETDVVHYPMGKSGSGFKEMFVQQLYQVNNPEVTASKTYATRQGAGLVPWFATHPGIVGAELAASGDVIGKKKEVIHNLFKKCREFNAAIGNTYHENLYVNDLGGFCIVEDPQSTGSGDYDGYVRAGNAWQADGTKGSIYDYNNRPVGYDFYNLSHKAPQAANGQTWCSFKKDPSERGQGGNTALFAQYINQYANSEIYNYVADALTPMGIVYMNFAGVKEVTLGGKNYDVRGINLPSLIISNNFKFALARKTN